MNKLAKELSLRNKLWYSNPISTHCCRPLILQTMNYDRLNDPSLKYQRFTSTGCRDVANVCGKNSISLSSDLWNLSFLCKRISSWMSSSSKIFSKMEIPIKVKASVYLSIHHLNNISKFAVEHSKQFQWTKIDLYSKHSHMA